MKRWVGLCLLACSLLSTGCAVSARGRYDYRYRHSGRDRYDHRGDYDRRGDRYWR